MRWFFWYIDHQGQFTSYGPEPLSDYDAWRLENSIRSRYLGARLTRFVWQPGWLVWNPDVRDDRQLLAGSPPTKVYA